MPEERVLRSRVPYEGLVIERNFLARTLVESAPEQGRVFDVIVVGSGMGGGTLADALADAGVNTLLLEAGSLLFPSNVADLPRAKRCLCRQSIGESGRVGTHAGRVHQFRRLQRLLDRARSSHGDLGA
jgi:choline dehydrogenase-like flavoprotein